jgi:peptidyl-prolyl cis-trans isomerase C
MVRASHILITPKPEPGADPNKAKADAKKTAEDLLKQIKGGADFADLAKKNSSCPSAAKGGDLDWFGKGRMVPEFDKAAFAMKVGEVSDIVETQFGYHIIKLTARRAAGTMSFEDAKPDIMEFLKQTKQKQFYDEYLAALTKSANIVYPPGKEPEAPKPQAGQPITIQPASPQ